MLIGLVLAPHESVDPHLPRANQDQIARGLCRGPGVVWMGGG